MRLWIALFVVIFAPSAAIASSTGPQPLPFTVTAQHMIEVPVVVGAGAAHPFLLDTGGGVDVMSMRLVTELHGRPTGAFSGFRLTGERLDLELYTVPELRLGTVVEKNALVAGWGGLDRLHVAGILSLTFFRNHPFTLDMRSKRLFFEDGGSLRVRRARGSTAPIRLDDLRGISLDLFAPFTLDGHKALCEVDTGSQGYMFALRYMKMLGLRPGGPGVQDMQATSILGHREQRYLAPVASIRLAGTGIAAAGASSALFEDLIYDCDVGMDFFQNRTVTFDIPSRQLIVSAE